MPAKRVEVQVARISSILICALFFKQLLPAQNSINDVHVAPRTSAATLSASVSGHIDIASNLMLHVIKTSVNLVLVPVSVTDARERFVTGLDKSNFQVIEGKKPQTIQHFSSEDVPLSIGIVLDVSGSMGDKMSRLREAVSQFCQASNPQDQFFMITFADEPRLVADFTSSSSDIEKELLFAQPKGRTSLLDAIDMGLAKLRGAKYGRKALLLISDGGDNHSRVGEKRVRALSKESDVMIYSIGVFDRYVSTIEESLGPSLLSEIAEPTGGRAYTLSNPAQMPALARHIGVELRNQYVLTYRPDEQSPNGKWRKIKVNLMLPKKLSFVKAHAKSGYYPSQE